MNTHTLLVFIDEIKFSRKNYTYILEPTGSSYEIQLFQLRLSRGKGKRSNMSAKGLSGKTSFIPKTLPFIGFPLSLKLDLVFLYMNINRDYVSLETKFCSVCVFLFVTSSKLFALVFDFSALLGDKLN